MTLVIAGQVISAVLVGLTFVLYVVRGGQLRPYTNYLSNFAARWGIALILFSVAVGMGSRAMAEQPWYWYHWIALVGGVVAFVGHAVMTRRVHRADNREKVIS